MTWGMDAAMVSDSGHTAGAETPLPTLKIAAARVAVASHARDAQDCAELLAMLGILAPVPESEAQMRADEIDKRAKPCEFCSRRIVWVTMPDTSRVPLDPDPHRDGNFAIDLIDGVLTGGRLTRGQAAGMRTAHVGTYRRHALTCPQAQRWAKSLASSYAPQQRGLRAGRSK